MRYPDVTNYLTTTDRLIYHWNFSDCEKELTELKKNERKNHDIFSKVLYLIHLYSSIIICIYVYLFDPKQKSKTPYNFFSAFDGLKKANKCYRNNRPLKQKIKQITKNNQKYFQLGRCLLYPKNVRYKDKDSFTRHWCNSTSNCCACVSMQ